MFSDSVTSSEDCYSTRNTERSFNECTVQTDPYKIVHRGLQIGRQKMAQCQTSLENGETKATKQFSENELSSPKLLAFLKKAEAVLTEHLCKNARSKAFKNDRSDLDTLLSVKTKYCLRVAENTQSEFSVTGISWNCTGAMIGIAYGALDHENWCVHNGFVALWNLSRETVNQEIPDSKLECTGCVMSLKFHPTIPSLLAVGTFCGDLLVYNMAKDADHLVATAGCTEGGHTESINHIEWISDVAGGLVSTNGDMQRPSTVQLLTVGGEGRIICWRVDLYHSPAKMKCTKIFQIRNSDQPPLNKPIYTNQSSAKSCPSVNDTGAYAERSVCLTAAALSPHQEDQLIVGTDSGGILLCSLNKFAPMEPTDNSTLIRHPSPVEFSLSRQMGPIQAVDWSKYHQNLVLSCGTGSTVRVHNTLQRDLFINLDPNQGNVLTARFSPYHANILVCASENGSLSIFDLLGGFGSNVEANNECETWNGPTLLHTATPDTDTSTDSDQTSKGAQSVTVLSFNHKDSSLLASGDRGGHAWIWTIDGIRSPTSMQVEPSMWNRLFKLNST